MKKGNVLVTGGAGYLGNVLTARLTESGYSVKVIDSLLYKQKVSIDLKNVEFVKVDLRNISLLKKSLKNVEYIIHLAALVGDSICASHPQDAYEINVEVTNNLLRLANGNIKKFIYASTCSVYGYNNYIVKENSKLNPVSFYAWTKIRAEKAVLREAENGLDALIFRTSTLYGLSQRIRFDLFVNRFIADAFFTHKLELWGGFQWRPVLHLIDAADAYISALKKPKTRTRGQIYNLGSTDQNYKIELIAKIIAGSIKNTKIQNIKPKDDARNYKVNCAKIRKYLGFKTKYDIKFAIDEIVQAFQKGNFRDYTSLKYINYLSTHRNIQKDRIWERLFLSGA